MKDHPARTVKDVAACQARCLHTLACAHYSFWETGKECHLHTDIAVAVPNQPMFVSGPPTCEHGGERELQLASSALADRICYQREIAYLPMDSPMHSSLPQDAETPADCR